ncbi:MAG: CoA transferase, partial [Rhodospirillales bacterium]|nr:CoA transferase [Rhodospirillales bacterium]
MTGSFAELMDVRGGDLPPDGEVTITGADPVYSTRFKIGDTAASVLASIGVAVSDIWDLKTGRRQNVTIDTRHAAAALRSTLYMQRPGADGTYALVAAETSSDTRAMTQPWPTKDGRWFLPHFSLAHLQARVQGVLGCEATPESVAKAVATWDALDLEAAIDEAGGCGAMVRSNAEWLEHPHGKALQAKPVVEIIKIGDSDPEPFPDGALPLSGIRTLDLTRILAGPIAARTLAENGADVLMVAAEHLPQVDEHVMDTSHGKRSCFIDLKTTEGVSELKELVRGADVFSQ